MARRMLDLQGVEKEFPWTNYQIYHYARRAQDPLPHRKIGKKLYFDEEKIWKWFERQPGSDGEDIS